MADQWRAFTRDSTSPAQDVVAIDVSAADHVPDAPYRALRVTGAGNVAVDTMTGVNRVLAFADGETRPVYVFKVYKTGTTATGIEGHV
ncbi:hypothetical protein FJ955_03025 [Mesorhizobium sp. B2-2-2]|uniref:spike base protein, RCAP_Rcc01079 family n=1 Tax=Mesorhizobium sp. B2-2-2 TaxID=2589964 RepID=UPI00112A4F9B|nr:hypothetical protein [Mesorhizobium sp. B2-2-2]TPM33728.1 hypothetical protein FJ955_03025 [Mesorhizobium sp. B2-2-2]